MKILVTGATGFLGRHVIERLRDNHQVIAFVRRESPDLGVDVVLGDVTDAASLEGAAEGCDVMIHMAGRVSSHPDDAKMLYDLHVTGTENALAEARRAGVKRVVYLSTSGTVAISTDPDFIANERSPTPRSIIYRWPYYRTKLIAEEIALAANGPELEVVSLNPSLLLGPGDPSGESSKSVRMFLEGELPVAPSGGLSFADARDVAEAVEAALDKGRPGSRYLLGAANMTFMAYYERLARLTNQAPPAVRAPQALRKVLDLLPQWGKDGFGFGMTVDRTGMEQGCHTWYLDDRRARVELGWSPRDPVATLRDTVTDLLDGMSGRRRPPGL